MGSIQFSIAMSTSGLFFAFFRGWWFSLILFFAFPILFFGKFLYMMVIQNGFLSNMKAYGQSAGYADQALNAIRVV